MIAKLLISASLEVRVEEIAKILSANFPNFPNHPDLLYFKAGEKLGVEQAKQIREHFSLKPYSAKGRAVVLEEASVMTLEAQNALLKTLEEPPDEAILLLGASSDAEFLPTVLSRVEVVHVPPAVIPAKAGIQRQDPHFREDDKWKGDLEKLVDSSLEERFLYIEKLKEKEEFLYFMVGFFRGRMLKNPTPEMKFFVGELLEAEKWAASNVNLRGILEYLMLIIPQEK